MRTFAYLLHTQYTSSQIQIFNIVTGDTRDASYDTYLIQNSFTIIDYCITGIQKLIASNVQKFKEKRLQCLCCKSGKCLSANRCRANSSHCERNKEENISVQKLFCIKPNSFIPKESQMVVMATSCISLVGNSCLDTVIIIIVQYGVWK